MREMSRVYLHQTLIGRTIGPLLGWLEHKVNIITIKYIGNVMLETFSLKINGKTQNNRHGMVVNLQF